MMPAPIGEALQVPCSNKEGWVSAMCRRIMLHTESNGYDFGICFPIPGGQMPRQEQIPVQEQMPRQGQLPVQEQMQSQEPLPVQGQLPGSERVHYYGFSENTAREETYDEALEKRMREIITDFMPDVLHCFGTEYGHTLAALRVFGNPEKSLVGLQGICYKIAEHYLDGIPDEIAKKNTLRDLLKSDNLVRQKEKMGIRGEREKECFCLTGNVTGRTSFDKESVKAVNPSATYHFMNETLRLPFYEGQWKFSECEEHSIFMSQGNYPVKGLHFVLAALPLLLERFPDTHLYVAGDNIIKDSFAEKMKISSYGKYLMDLIHEGKLESHVTFLGQLTAVKMKDRMLKSHVFLSASTIENSPNSVGEAMLLGVPVVASEVGGVPDILRDGSEGLLYTADNAGALNAAIGRVFTADATRLEAVCENARRTAKKRHDQDTNYVRLLEIYESLA